MNLDQSVIAIMDQIQDGIYFVDSERKITYWNRGAERITGFSAQEVVGKHCYDNILNHIDQNGNRLCFGPCPLAETIHDGDNKEARVFLHHKKGHRVPVLVRTSQYKDHNDTVQGGIELFTDISDLAQHETRVKELEKLAMIDTLTEVANRYYLTQQLESSFEERRRYQLPFGVLFLDIDHFKQFNDTYGHDVGDQVLQLVSRTLTRSLRPFDLLGRWGGEEFLAIVRNVTEKELTDVAERFRTLVENSFIPHESDQIEVTVSIGGTLCLDEDTPGTIQKRADSLMYVSKESGRNRVTIG